MSLKTVIVGGHGKASEDSFGDEPVSEIADVLDQRMLSWLDHPCALLPKTFYTATTGHKLDIYDDMLAP